MTTSHQVRGFIAQIKLDAAGFAVVEHGAGKVPTAVTVQPGGPGQLASIVPSSYTDKTFRVKMNWHDGRLFAAGTPITLAVQVTYEADPVEPPAPGKRCELPIATVTAQRGAWAKPGNPNVRVLNEVWNSAEGGPQTLYVCDETSWYVKTNQPAAHVQPDRYGAVKSYPCTQVLFPKTPLSSLTSLVGRFAHETPEGDFEWNACYDIWIGGLGQASTAEVMVWTDHTYPGRIPASNALKVSNLTLDGINYVAWTRKNSNGGDYIALVASQKRSHGTVDLLAVFKWLVGLGWLKSTDTLAAVNYGIEISHTNKTEQIFRVNDFDLTWSSPAV